MTGKFLLLLVFFLVSFFPFWAAGPIFAQAQNPQGKSQTTVEAAVGDFFLNLSGIASPFASIVVTSDNLVLKSTVADANGRFSFPQILIRAGFSRFCLETIDFKRIGTSLGCVSIPPATKSVTIKDLYLPPTLGLFRTQIQEGKSAIAFGYTVPGGKVKLCLENKKADNSSSSDCQSGKAIETVANASGFYQFEIGGVKAGNYQLSSKGRYEEKDSLDPAKKVDLKAVPKKVGLWTFFTSWSLGPLWIAIPVIILIIILIILIWRLLKNRKKLHHWWFVGF